MVWKGITKFHPLKRVIWGRGIVKATESQKIFLFLKLRKIHFKLHDLRTSNDLDVGDLFEGELN